jgi:uncharacterized protein
MITRRRLLRIFAALGVSSFALAAFGVLVEPFRWPKVTQYDVRPRNWPADLALKIAVVADVHACSPWMTVDRTRSIVDTTNGLGTDLIVLLGDYAAGHRFVYDTIHSDDWSAALAGLKAPLGVHAILGECPDISALLGRRGRRIT